MSGKEIEELDDVIQNVKKSKKKVVKQTKMRANFHQNNSIKSFKSYRSNKSANYDRKFNQSHVKPYTKLNYLGVLPEEPPSNSQTMPFVSRDERPVIPTISLIERDSDIPLASTTEHQGSVVLIVMPNTGSKRPANNVDQMMSFNEEPSRRKDTTMVTDMHCLSIELAFSEKMPVQIAGGYIEDKWVQLQKNGKLVIFNQNPEGDNLSPETIQQIQALG